MIDKKFIQKNGKQVAQVTFIVPHVTQASSVHLVGDFNDWNQITHLMQNDQRGRWTLTIELAMHRAYQFRYWLDSQIWMQDSQADAYVYNPQGQHNFVIITDPNFKPYNGQ